MVRVKNRYLVVHLLYPITYDDKPSTTALPPVLHFHRPTHDAFQIPQLLRVIRDSVGELFGEYGSGMVNGSLKVNYFSTATSTAIVRCPREHYRMVQAALTLITKLRLPLQPPMEVPVVMRVVRVSGTIKKAEREVIALARELIQRAKEGQGTEEEMVETVRKAVEKRERGEAEAEAMKAPVEESDEDEGSSGSEGD